MDIPYETSFQDLNYTEVLLRDLSFIGDDDWAAARGSGYAAAAEGTNMSQYLSFQGYVLNGTSRKIRQHVHRTFALNDSRPGGILPIMPSFDNWTRVEAIQQGLTAEVNCKAMPSSHPDIRINQTSGGGITEVSLCCKCTSGSTAHFSFGSLLSTEHVSGIPSPFASFFTLGGPSLAFTICPISNADNVISMTSIPLLSPMIVLTKVT